MSHSKPPGHPLSAETAVTASVHPHRAPHAPATEAPHAEMLTAAELIRRQEAYEQPQHPASVAAAEPAALPVSAGEKSLLGAATMRALTNRTTPLSAAEKEKLAHQQAAVDKLPDAGEAEFRGEVRRTALTHKPVTAAEHKALAAQQQAMMETYDVPHGTDNTVAGMRAVGGVVSIVPGPGTMASIAIGGVATLVDIGGAIAHGDSWKHVARTAGSGVVETGVGAIPGPGIVRMALGVTTGVAVGVTGGADGRVERKVLDALNIHPFGTKDDAQGVATKPPEAAPATPSQPVQVASLTLRMDRR